MDAEAILEEIEEFIEEEIKSCFIRLKNAPAQLQYKIKGYIEALENVQSIIEDSIHHE